MFGHIFIYRLKVFLRDKTVIFWTLAFPLMMAILFKLAFGGLATMDNLQTIRVATHSLDQSQELQSMVNVMNDIDVNGTPLFMVGEVSISKAETLLKDGDVTAILYDQEGIRVQFHGSGMMESVLKSFLDQYGRTSAAIGDIVTADPQVLEQLIASMETQEIFTQSAPNTKELDMMLNYFYTLLAMACMYGALFGMKTVEVVQANLSSRAVRLNVSPVHKFKAFLAGGSASFLIHLMQMAFLLTFMVVVLGVDFGDRMLYVIIAVFTGSLVGVSFGTFVSALVKGGEGLKLAIILSVSLVGSMLAGLMHGDIKYMVAQHVPILMYLNPVNLIADGFYALYFYDTMHHFYLNMSILTAFAVVFCVGTYLSVRRRKYANL